jgi:FSR family fosmidomycin resistance protein-like MFS transporter
MSLFTIGGNLGYALGAIVATPLVVWLGLEGGLLLMVPCLVVAALLLRTVRFLSGFALATRDAAVLPWSDNRPALTLLLGVITFRSVAWFGLVTFVPLWEVSLGNSKAHGNHLLSAMLLAGGVGTLIVGPLADRFGRRVIVVLSLVATPPLILVFVMIGGFAGAVALALAGVCLVGTFGVTTVMSQEYLPRHIAMASGLSIGLSIGLGGIAAVGLGALADSVDLRAALYVCAAAPVAALALAVFLPADRLGRGLAPELVAP